MRRLLSVIVIVSLTSFGVFAQNNTHGVNITISNVAQLSIVRPTGGSINLTGANGFTFLPPLVTGQAIRNPSPSNNTALWLNYTSITAGTPGGRSIKVKIQNGGNPSGAISFRVSGQSATPTGTGNVGSSVEDVTLALTDRIFVPGVGSGYTGIGATGVNLRYSVGLAGDGSYSQLTAGSVTYTILYTLSDD